MDTKQKIDEILSETGKAVLGKLRNGYAFAGANAWRAEKIQSVKELIGGLKREYDEFSLRDKLFGAKQ